MVFDFGNSLGWFAFFVLIPFIILYLIKPKPTKLKVPSLVFFMNKSKSSKIQSLFRYFQNDLLFLIQLLILILFAFSITKPSLTLNSDVVSSNIVFILDVSASSKVIEGDTTRLELAKDKIEDLATSKNSLILLKSSPVVALQDVSRSRLISYLNKVESTDDTTDIASAINLAGDLLLENHGRVVVVSDFVYSSGIDPSVSKSILESRGIPVDFIDVGKGNKTNVGIVNLMIKDKDVNVYVKNYGNYSKEVNLNVNKQNYKLNIGKNSIEPFVFTLKDNFTKIEIQEKDDFLVDNSAIINVPYTNKLKVLLITNNPSKFLKAALTSIGDISLTIAEPPIVPDKDFDLYVIDKVNRNSLVVDTFGGIFRKVRDEGKPVIILSQKEIGLIDFEGLLDVEFGNVVSGGVVSVNQVNRLTKDMEFGSLSKVVQVKTDGLNLLSVGNESVLSILNIGKGKVAYYGLLEEESDFKLTPSYPVFWNNLVYYLTGREDLNELNLKTGNVLTFGNESVTLDKAGVYEYQDKKIAVNLLNEMESDLNYQNVEKVLDYDTELESVKSKVDYDLIVYLASFILLLVLFEFAYIRVRGEV